MSLVASIVRAGWNPTSASAVKFNVTFTDPVTGVDATDFVVTAAGVTGATVTDVSGSGKNYTVTVTTGTGEGTLRLDVVDDDSIVWATPFGNVSIGGPGAGNGNFSSGEAYTVDRDADNTPPELLSFVRTGSNPTNAASVDYTLTFSESVTGVDASDFLLGRSGFSSAPFISNVSGSGTTWTVTVDTGSGDGEIGLRLKGRSGIGFIVDAAGIPINTTTNGWYESHVLISILPTLYETYGNFDAESYSVDKTAPTVLSVVRAGTDPTNAASVDYTVKFSENVTGVDASDFTLTAIGVSGAGILGVSGLGDTWTVTVNTGSGDGTIRLNLVDDDTIADGATNTLDGGFTAGQAYELDRTTPTDIALLPGSVDENSAAGTVVGTLSAADAAAFALVSGAGDTDNDLFEIVGHELRVKTGAQLNFEHHPTHSLRVSVTDVAGNSFEKALMVTVVNVVELQETGDLRADIAEGSAYTITVSDLYAQDDGSDVSGIRWEILSVRSGTLLVDGAEATAFTAAQIAANKVLYQHDGSESYLGSFDFRMTTDSAGVMRPWVPFNLYVSAVNDAPVAGNVTLPSVQVNSGARVITSAQLLANTTDVDSATLTVTGLHIDTGLGALINNGDGTWIYTPKTNDDTEVTFAFTVSDGQASSNAQAKLDITSAQSAPEIGTPGDDTFTAVTGNATYIGLGGIDTINLGFKLTEATVTYDGNKVIIDSASSHTVLTGFEKFAFTDGTVDNSDTNPLIDDLFYYSRYHDVWSAHVDADFHYNAAGWHEGRDPSAFFNTSIYLAAYPDVAAGGSNPLTHYDMAGWKEGYVPSIEFGTREYLDANPDVKAANIDPLRHFLAVGASEGRQPIKPTEIAATNGFDFVYYLANSPDVAAAGVDPFWHFQNIGWKEGRNPNAYFDTAGYLAVYTDVADAHINPLDHYGQHGWHEGRDPSPGFDTTSYLAANPDVAAAHVNPLAHFLQAGHYEGRSAIADGVWG